VPICGDGLKVGADTCDAGSNPGCLSNCSGEETGYQCNEATPDVCNPICGDGRVISPETCDDGPANHLSPFSVTGCLSNCLGID